MDLLSIVASVMTIATTLNNYLEKMENGTECCENCPHIQELLGVNAELQKVKSELQKYKEENADNLKKIEEILYG